MPKTKTPASEMSRPAAKVPAAKVSRPAAKKVLPSMTLLISQMKGLEKSIENANKGIQELRLQMVQHSPVKVGDIIEVTAHAYRGKKMKVDDVKVTKSYWGVLKFHAKGKVLRADGTPGLKVGECFIEIRKAK